MKKYLLSALALPLLFACSSEDYLDQKATDNDQFAGIEKVDATFSLADMDEGSSMRLAKDWGPELNDRLGFAWLTDGKEPTPVLNLTGEAYQNHPLFLRQEGDKYKFVPETSIYVGKYFVYYPYDETTVDIGKINFTSLEEQTITDGMGGESWAAVAKNSINIGDKWTNVTKGGTPDASDPEKFWEKAGIKQNYHLYAAPFSNQTGLDLTYKNNNVEAPAAGMHITGATDIDYTIAAGTKIGAADIYGGTVDLQNTLGTSAATNSFTYAPVKEPANGAAHNGAFWADKSATSTFKVDNTNGFTFTKGAITLTAADENGVPTEGKTKGWFWFNSLPATEGNATEATNVITVLETSYGQVTVKKDYDTDKNYTVKDCAFAYNVESGVKVWHPLADVADGSKTPTVWAVAGTDAGKETFINQYGDHKGKFALTVDFSKGVMNGMHIKNDAHLQKLLKYYIAAGKTETGVVLNLDADVNGEFKISKISIALLQTINATVKNVLVKPCATHGTPKVIVTQDGQKELGLDDATEVPSLKWVFYGNTDVYLSSEDSWTWSGGEDYKTPVTTDGFIKSIINEGTLTVNATNVEASYAGTALKNAAGATMNITKVTTVKNALTNLGTINVKENAELRAYGVEIKNDATGLKKGEYGVINNSGVIGVSEGVPGGKFNNYGLIDMKVDDAITLLTSNEMNSQSPNGPFKGAFTAGSNMMGTVKLPDNNPTALVSVANTAENGFIKYNWDEKTYVTPKGIVKYNTIVVDDDITFGADAPEIQFIEFDGKRTQVVNPEATNHLGKLRGIIVNAGKSIIIEKTNIIDCADGVFLGTGATIYRGGKLQVGSADITTTAENNYLGTWNLEQIVKY